MKHPEYPIYHVRFRWPEEGKYCHDGMNGTSSTFMLREPNISEANRIAFAQAERLCEEKNVAAEDMDITVSISHYEEWCCNWFSHYTFDVGQSDAEALSSFGSFVDRTMRYNRKNQVRHVTKDGDVFYSDPRCLMGAEDRSRWTARAGGTSMIGCGESSGEAPCRCEGCREHGVLSIDH